MVLAAFSGPAASACPPVPDQSAQLRGLFDRARAASSESEGRLVSGLMWQVWLQAPDDAAQQVLDRGLARRSSFDFLGAMADFERLIDYCPHFAEGFNQRAYIHFLREDFADALSDLDRALVLSPDHVPALTGRALTLLKLGQIAQARQQLQAALALNPWLSERFLLLPGGPLAPKGEDI